MIVGEVVAVILNHDDDCDDNVYDDQKFVPTN